MAEKSEAGLSVEIPGGFKLEAFATDSTQVVDESKRQIRNIESLATSDGHDNHPPTEAISLSSTEQRAVDFCQDRLDGLARKASYALNHLKNRLERQFHEIGLPDFRSIEQEIYAKAQKVVSESRTHLADLQKEERLSLRDLKRFAFNHQLNRPAEYPESGVLNSLFSS
ncbi:MAG: hypothetical protein OEU92_11070 [Alphaproteobacteria bacterium]|nr:hypothetical protein [Alphaproteobacteria bacterium]